MVLKFAMSKQEKVENYPRVSTQFNSACGQINVANAYTTLVTDQLIHAVSVYKKR